MVFSSTIFLCVYLPLVLLGYYICPKKGKNLFLLIVSLVFYAWGEPKYVFLMIFSILINYVFGLLMDKHRENKKRLKLMLVLSVAIDLGLLSVFKYTDFIITNINSIFNTGFDLLNIALPIGISFYTFQAMSYTIDVYRDNVRVQRNLIDFGMYITMFPQLIAGPIVRYADVQDHLAERSVTTADFSEGIMRFVVGLGKKVLLANQMGAVWTDIYALGGDVSALMAWTGAVAFTFQIYFDFSGYSLMAIGLGKMLGFEFPQNFNDPYIAKSVTDFWRRWHMTLGSWFREYLYFPLGGNRCSKGRHIFNMFVVWAATGLWHGASWNFVLWGLYFFVFLVLEKYFLLHWLERSLVLSHLYLLFLVVLSWALFAITDFSALGRFLTALFAGRGGTEWVYYFRSYIVTFVIAAVCSTPALSLLGARLKKKAPALLYAAAALVLVVSCAYLVDATYNPFLYFRF